MESIVYISNARLSFPHLSEPQKKVNEATGEIRISYNCELIFEPDHSGYVKFIEVYSKLAFEKWKPNTATVMSMILADRKSRCFGNGDDKINKKTFLPYNGYQGNTYVTVGRDTPPQMILDNGKPVEPGNTMLYQQVAQRLYGGCRVNAAIKPWLQDNKHGRGVRSDLIAIQFFQDDTAFGEGSVDASHMFGAVAGHNEDADEFSSENVPFRRNDSAEAYRAAKGY
jgi:hypothetical protein